MMIHRSVPFTRTVQAGIACSVVVELKVLWSWIAFMTKESYYNLGRVMKFWKNTYRLRKVLKVSQIVGKVMETFRKLQRSFLAYYAKCILACTVVSKFVILST